MTTRAEAIAALDTLRAFVEPTPEAPPVEIPQGPAFADVATVLLADTLVLAGERIAYVRLRLEAPVGFPVGLTLQTANGVGTYPPKWYVAKKEYLLFQPGETEKVVPVALARDLGPTANIKVTAAWSTNYPPVKGATALIRQVDERPVTEAREAPVFTAPKLIEGRRLAFESAFQEPVTHEAVPGAWRSRFGWGRWQSTNKELAPYTHAETDPGVTPHSHRDGKFVLRAEKAPVSYTTQSGGQIAFDFSAPMIQSENLFTFKYGYLEFRAILPDTPGSCAAVWLLPADRSWPPELDIIEVLLGGKRQVTTAVHQKEEGQFGGIVAWPTFPAGDGQFHTYGLDLTPEWITILLDGEVVLRWVNRAYHVESYLTFNIAVGGITSAPQDTEHGWISEMVLDYLKVWKN